VLPNVFIKPKIKKMKTRSIICITCLIYFLLTRVAASQNAEWIFGIGNIDDDYSTSMITDVSGNVYVTGIFEGTVDFDPGIGIYALSTTGSVENTFIAKFNANGDFVWAKQFEGEAISESMTTDASGDIYITGHFYGTVDFYPGAGVFNLSSAGNEDIFISKLDTDGNFITAIRIGGNQSDEALDLTIDNLNNIYVTGYFEDTVDFDPSSNINNIASAGGNDIFILKLSASGDFLWVKQIGGLSTDRGYDIKIDSVGEIYVLGTFYDMVDFDFESSVDIHNSNGSKDIFILKLDASGSFIWAKSIGGLLNDVGNDIDLDSQDNIYITGYFYDTVDFDPNLGTSNLISTGSRDIFILKLDTSGNFIWAKGTGGINSDIGKSIYIHTDDSIYVTGYFYDTVDFSPQPNDTFTSEGVEDIFLTKIDQNGNSIVTLTAGGIGYDSGSELISDAMGNIYMRGYFEETVDFNPGPGEYELTSSGGYDFFLQKLSDNTLNVNSHDFEKTLVAYPNPTSENSTIKLGQSYDDVTLTIRTVTGQLVTVRNYKTTDSIDFSIDANSGIYFAEVLADNSERASLKIIKK